MTFSWDILTMLAPALIAGALISLAHVALGIEVLRRGIIFLDLAVAQCAAFGMLVFHVYMDNENMDPLYAQIGALVFGLCAALFCALALHMMEKRTGKYQEAMIGCTFVLAASLSILIMSEDPHSGEQMKDILAGQILWVNWSDLYWSGPVFVFSGLIWMLLPHYRAKLFYPLFALTIPFSVNLVGVYLVFASLILPALATIKMIHGRWLIAYIISVSAFAGGLGLSYSADFPSGPAIILVLFGIAIGFFTVNKKSGH